MILTRLSTLWQAIISFFRRVFTAINRSPMRSFIGVLLITFILILIGNYLRKPKIEQVTTPPPKQVETYTIGTIPTVRTQGKIEKSGVIDIMAQTGGIVSAIRVKEGQAVPASTQLLSLANNYQGGNSASLGRELAQRQNKNITNTYDASKELITKQKQLADANRDNAKDLRDITQKSLDDSNGLLKQNEDILSTISTSLGTLEQNNVNGSNDALILTTKQLQSQYQASVNQLQAAIRQSTLQTDENKSPTALSNLTHDVAIKQLEIQEKALDLTRDVSAIQLRIAYVNEAMMYPAAPFAGTVQRVYVRVGQSVTPGTILATIAGGSKEVKIVAQVPAEVARRVATLQDSILYLPHGTVHLHTPYVPTDTTNGALSPIVYPLSSDDATAVRDNSYLTLDIPVGYPDSATASSSAALTIGQTVFIPLNAVFQTQETSLVYVIDGDHAKSRVVTLGQVFGAMVEVTSGVSANDEVILTRTVLDGENVVRNNATDKETQAQ